jgi:hypothetical protein
MYNLMVVFGSTKVKNTRGLWELDQLKARLGGVYKQVPGSSPLLDLLLILTSKRACAGQCSDQTYWAHVLNVRVRSGGLGPVLVIPFVNRSSVREKFA